MMNRVRPILWVMLAASLVLLLSWGCAGVDALGDDDLFTGDGGPEQPDLLPEGCFMGTPETESELLNRCTDAERVERPSRIPESVWDGKGPLPEIP